MTHRRPLAAANWKMNKTLAECASFFETLNAKLPKSTACDVVVCPPFTLLERSVSLARNQVALGAQDLFWEAQGAYTGEISGMMLRDIGCKYVIIGHSERRQHFGETNQSVNKKVSAALKQSLVPILCVGETLQEMESGRTKQVVQTQLEEGLKGISLQGDFVLAYEPVWAIGTGKSDTPEQSNQTIGFVRTVLAKAAGQEFAARTRILYGGSVKPDNIKAFMAQPEIDGGLVGGASLDPHSFLSIVEAIGA